MNKRSVWISGAGIASPLGFDPNAVWKHIEEGETAWQAALRELKEEADLTPTAFYSAEVCEQFYSHEIDAIMLFPVFVAIIADDAKVTLNEEHSDYRWMSRSEAERHLPFPNQRVILARVWTDFVDNKPTPLLQIPVPG